MSNLPSVTLPVWQTKHLFLKTGSTSAPYSTGVVRLRSTVGMGGRSLSFFGSWAAATAASVTAAKSVGYRIGSFLGNVGYYFATVKLTFASWLMVCFLS